MYMTLVTTCSLLGTLLSMSSGLPKLLLLTASRTQAVTTGQSAMTSSELDVCVILAALSLFTAPAQYHKNTASRAAVTDSRR